MVSLVAGSEDRTGTERVGAPLLSVIVTLHDRTCFVREALDSLLSQTLDRSQFEVILVGKYEDDELDGWLAGRPFHVLRTTSSGLGEKLAEAVRNARGEILVFLEDDDRFVRTKLVELAARFRSDPRLTFVRNGFVTIDPEGRPWDGPFYRRRAQQRLRRIGSVYIEAPVTAGKLRALSGVFPGFNNSCISVRERAVRPYLDLLARSDLIADEFLWLTALASGGSVLVDERPLTEFRVHGASVSDPSAGREEGGYGRLLAFSARTLAARGSFSELARRAGRPDLGRLVRAGTAIQATILLLRSDRPDRSSMARNLGTMIQGLDSYEVQSFRPVLGLALLYLLAPNVAIRLYRAAKRVEE